MINPQFLVDAFLVTGQAGRQVILQGGPDLFHWANLGYYTNAGGTLSITHTLPIGRLSNFYRTYFRDGTNPFVAEPSLSNPMKLSSNRMQFRLNATPGTLWKLEGSSDLWRRGYYGVLTNAGSLLLISNAAQRNPPAYFYRVVHLGC